MPIPYNVFGGFTHRRWIVSGGGTTGDQQYVWSDKLIPGADDWNGPYLYPQLSTLGSGYNMSQIEYDHDRDMFMIVGTVQGTPDMGSPLSYPNWSPYILRSYDLMDSWETTERAMNVEWLNVEPGFWGGANVGHLHYDPFRRRMYMLGGLTTSVPWGRPDTSAHVSFSDDGGDTWTTFADQRQDPANDAWGWGNSSWFIRQRRPPHFPLATGNVVAACGTVVARRRGTSDDWLVSVGGPPDTDDELPRDTIGDPGSSSATNRISRDFWGLTPTVNSPGWLIGNENTAASTAQLGSLMYNPSPTLSRAFFESSIPDVAIVQTVGDTTFEGHKYTGASGDPGGSKPIRHGRITIANGRMWSHAGYAGTELNDDAFLSSASGSGAIWRRDQDFRLSSLAPTDGVGGYGEFTQHPFFDLSAYPATGAIHDLAQNRQDPNLIMCVGRIANASRYSNVSNRFLYYSISQDGGLSWSPPIQFDSSMNQPYYVWSV